MFWCSADATSEELIHAHDMGKPVLEIIPAGDAMFWVLLDVQWIDPFATSPATTTASSSVNLIRLSPTQVHSDRS